MNSRDLMRWSRMHERRAGGIPSIVYGVAFGAALAAWVWYRGTTPSLASHAWLAGALVAYGLAFLRVPFLIYWRSDAPLLAQLPIPGLALFDAAIARCLRAAITTTIVAGLGLVPLLVRFPEIALHHAGIMGALFASAAGLMPGVAVWAASLVDRSILETVSALGGAPVADDAKVASPQSQGSAMLGAVPGFAATIVIVVVIVSLKRDPIPLLSSLVAASLVVILAVRANTAKHMGTILRDVSALDRQRLATLEIREPTAIEKLIGKLIGDARLPYEKDARLVRRRYPMAFALGALIFVILVGVGLARPADPSAWLVVTFSGAIAYAVALHMRLRRAPIELPRVSASLPIAEGAIRRAKIAWIVGWLAIFVFAPGAFALLRSLP